ncbi:MAG: hypothetical protein KTR24_03730 [Saprospiraceae bacterium]|nr:hypothetical protein [Saprospiraceae bacterium]
MREPRPESVERLVRLIEQQLQWGPGQEWSNKDFDQLSALIFESTHKQLSVTTLKRVWGRAERSSNPSQTTLDILAEFAGRSSWRSFLAAPTSLSSVEKDHSANGRRSNAVWIAMPLLLVVAYFSISALLNKTATSLTPPSFEASEMRFKSKVISNDLPNSVVFAYDVSRTPIGTKIAIQQDWDASKRIPISREDSIATCIYYRPGFFKAKLVVDSSIMLRDDVFITTRDWLGLIRDDPTPIYFDHSEVNLAHEISIRRDLLLQYGRDPNTEDVNISLYNVNDFGDIHTHNLDISMSVSNTHTESRHRCRGAYIYLLFDGSAISIPLVSKGCIAQIDVMTFDEYVDGSTNDLSAFGVDIDAFQHLQFVGQDSSLQVYLNDVPVYKMKAPPEPLHFKGMSVHFEGTGTIRGVQVRKRMDVTADD